MEITEQILADIEKYGGMHISPRRVCILLDLKGEDMQNMLNMFRDTDSEIARVYEKGMIKKDVEITESLEDYIKDGGENAGEAAKALGEIRRRQFINEITKELFNV